MLVEIAQIAAICLALSAAYLRFDPFQCRQTIRHFAKPFADNFAQISTGQKKLDQYKLISVLANEEYSRKDLKELGDYKPVLMDRWFLIEADRTISWIILIGSSIYIILTALSYVTTDGGECQWACDYGILSWILFSLFLISSLMFIFYGRLVIENAQRRIERAAKQLTESMGEASKIAQPRPR